MCGICGIASARGAADPERLAAMSATLTHRGPDSDGAFVEGPVALAARRLSIIDLDTGDQPIANEDGTVVVVQNGEIYNYAELTDELARTGHRFRTHGDTEVIVHAYEQWGLSFAERLRGMFAIAIWDGPGRRLWLARDRIGIKPLYYSWDGRRCLFASEVKGILEHPGVPRVLDPAGIDDYLTYAYVPAPRSAFRDIRKLEAGHMLSITERGVTDTAYWDVDLGPRAAPRFQEAAAALLDTVRESVGAHLVSDVPLGALLSGGLDSSAVTGLMSRCTAEPVHAISVGFPGADADELPFARIAARAFGARQDEVRVAEPSADLLDTLAWHYDEPFADPSATPTYLLCETARRRVTVCLSGDGGDESFCGYRRYRVAVTQGGLAGAVRARVGANALAGSLARAPAGRWLPKPLRRESLLTRFGRTPEEQYRAGMTLFGAELKERLYAPGWKARLGGHDPASVLAPHLARAKGWDPVARLQYLDFKTYLADGILTKVDRASMAHGLEVRVPLLDHRVVELAASLPSRYKVSSGQGKLVFKRALKGLVPREILTRRKAGFTPPMDRWFRGNLAPLVEQRLFAPDAFVPEIFDRRALRALWEGHLGGTRNAASQLWAALMLESWARRFL
jgi:asparagine synthase (glutamine-hydrolysing)